MERCNFLLLLASLLFAVRMYSLTGTELVLNLPELMMFAFAVAARQFPEHVFFSRNKIYVGQCKAHDRHHTNGQQPHHKHIGWLRCVSVWSARDKNDWSALQQQWKLQLFLCCTSIAKCGMRNPIFLGFVNGYPVGFSFCFWFSKQKIVSSVCEKRFLFPLRALKTNTKIIKLKN